MLNLLNKSVIMALLLVLLVITPAPAAAATPKLAFGIYYPWYPFNGMFYADSAGVHPPQNINGYAAQTAFPYTFTNPIPYLWSGERKTGRYDFAAAVEWHRVNLQHYADIGLDAILVIGRPDLPTWYEMLASLLEARRLVWHAPKLAFYFDGVEYWDKNTPTTGNLTGPGPDFDAIWRGVEITYDIALRNPDDMFWFGTKIPIWFYRVEANAGPFTGSGWWVDQLRANVAARFHHDSYIVLDHYWHSGPPYGANNSIVLNSDNADNYSFWGGALSGLLVSPYSTGFMIGSLGPGFDNRKAAGLPGTVRDRNNGLWYISQWQLMATNSNIRWVTIETLNFGEEGSAIDQTDLYGAAYLNSTRTQIAAWKSS